MWGWKKKPEEKQAEVQPKKVLKPGGTVKYTTPDKLGPNTWCFTDGSRFKVRDGPDYDYNKIKRPSGPSFYEPFAADLFRSKQKIEHVARYLHLPSAKEAAELVARMKKEAEGCVDEYEEEEEQGVNNSVIDRPDADEDEEQEFDDGLLDMPEGEGQNQDQSKDKKDKEKGKGNEQAENKEADKGEAQQGRRKGKGKGADKDKAQQEQEQAEQELAAEAERAAAEAAAAEKSKPKEKKPLRNKDEEGKDKDKVDWTKSVPELLIINYQFPDYCPANPLWGARKEDGTGYSLITYFVLSDAGREAFTKLTTPAALTEYFLRECHTDGGSSHEIIDRMKCLPLVINKQEAQLWLNYILSKYNGRPYLCRPQQTYYRGENYIEIDIDIHRYSYTPRRTVYSYINQIQKWIFDVAHIIEARDDDEMPEQVLSCVRLSKLNPLGESAIDFPA